MKLLSSEELRQIRTSIEIAGDPYHLWSIGGHKPVVDLLIPHLKKIIP